MFLLCGKKARASVRRWNVNSKLGSRRLRILGLYWVLQQKFEVLSKPPNLLCQTLLVHSIEKVRRKLSMVPSREHHPSEEEAYSACYIHRVLQRTSLVTMSSYVVCLVHEPTFVWICLVCNAFLHSDELRLRTSWRLRRTQTAAHLPPNFCPFFLRVLGPQGT